MAKAKLPGVGALVQGVHDVVEVFVDINVKFLESGEIVKLPTVSPRQLLHVNIQLLIRNLQIYGLLIKKITWNSVLRWGW